MQKEKNPENATKLLSNLVGVAGAHIDALDAQGMHDKLYFNWTAFTQPEIVTKVLDYSQARTGRPPGLVLLGRSSRAVTRNTAVLHPAARRLKRLQHRSPRTAARSAARSSAFMKVLMGLGSVVRKPVLVTYCHVEHLQPPQPDRNGPLLHSKQVLQVWILALFAQ